MKVMLKANFLSQIFLTNIKINLTRQLQVVTSPVPLNYVGD